MREGGIEQHEQEGCLGLLILGFKGFLLGFMPLLIVGVTWRLYSENGNISQLYAGAILLISELALAILILRAIRPKRAKAVKEKPQTFVLSPQGVVLETHLGSVGLNNPYRGIFILGSAGSGKSESVGIPLLWSFLNKGFAGVIYDFKYPALANEVHTFLKSNRSDLRHFCINFNDVLHSHKINPIAPIYLKNSTYAREYATALVNNLMRESISKPDFWSRSATDLLTATIWYLHEEAPYYCDLPHVFALITSEDTKLIKLLQSNEETAQMTMSLYSAMQRKADGQISGVIGTLQGLVAQINTPDFMWVFSENDFYLGVNEPGEETVFTIGTSPGISSTVSPLCSLLLTVAAKQMNTEGKSPSFVLLDEAPTVYVPNLDILPNTGRSNKISTVIMCQDLAQLRDGYGKDKSDVLFAACNNHFYGRVSSSLTADVLSKQFGKEDKVYTSFGQSYGTSSDNVNSSQSEVLQERELIKPSEFLNFSVGEFAALLVESNAKPPFRAHFKAINRQVVQMDLGANGTREDIKAYYKRVRADINELLSGL